MAKLQFTNAITEDLKTAASDSFIDSLQMIEVNDILPNRDNFYSIEDINELAEDIERQGLMSILVVSAAENGKHTLISGHRRLEAVKKLIDSGKRKTTTVPCYIKGERSREETELDLIMLNATQRKYSDSERIREYEELERIFGELAKAGKPIKGNMREKMGHILNVSPAQVGKIENITRNGIADVAEAVKSGDMSISTANEVAKLAPEKQKEIIEGKPDISHKEVKELQKTTPPKPPKTSPAQPPKSAPAQPQKSAPTEQKSNIVTERYTPCMLSEREAGVLIKYIERLLEVAAESDREIIKQLAEKINKG